MPSTATREQPWEPLVNGRVLRRERLGKDLSYQELIRACWDECGTEVDKGNYHRTEAGERGAIGFRKLAAVCKVLGIGMDDVLTERGKRELTRRAA